MKKKLLHILTALMVILPSVSLAQAKFGEGSGRYGTLLSDLKNNLYEKSRIETVTLDGEERRMFISWVRDHIHTTKAYKYWEKDLASFTSPFSWGAKPKKACISITGNRIKIKMWDNCFLPTVSTTSFILLT